LAPNESYQKVPWLYWLLDEYLLSWTNGTNTHAAVSTVPAPTIAALMSRCRISDGLMRTQTPMASSARYPMMR